MKGANIYRQSQHHHRMHVFSRIDCELCSGVVHTVLCELIGRSPPYSYMCHHLCNLASGFNNLLLSGSYDGRESGYLGKVFELTDTTKYNQVKGFRYSTETRQRMLRSSVTSILCTGAILATSISDLTPWEQWFMQCSERLFNVFVLDRLC